MQQHHPILELFGRNVQRLRTGQNISQEKLAEKARLHRTYIGMVERAERNITLINMQKIANALGVEIGELLRYNYGEEAKI
ncbi:MAG: helix-turn-helix transcriptional regulator [Prevotella sp.]|nr:helix-turn-helix transcriptional regulator [Prevotella sp.]